MLSASVNPDPANPGLNPSPRILQAHEAGAAEDFLRAHIISSMFMLDNLKNGGAEYQGKPGQGEYWVSHAQTGEINGILVHNWNSNIMVQAPDDTALQAILSTVKTKIIRPISGVLGPDSQAVKVLEGLGLNTRNFSCNRAEGLYALDLSNLIPQSQPNTQIAEIADIDQDLLISWLYAYVIEALAYTDEAAKEDAIKRIENHKKSKNAWVLLHENTPVCLCGINAELPGIVQIGPVWTPPEKRGRGYARINVSLVLQKAMKNGIKQAVLFTDNPAAVKAYEAVGFALCGKYRLSLFHSPQYI